MIAAVTGGTGFLGRALVARLQRPGGFAEVRVLSRKARATGAARMFQGDLAAADAGLDAFLDGVSVVFHCAGELTRQADMRALHVEGTRRLLSAALRARVARWVQLSSVGAYGRALRAGTVDEVSPVAPQGEYETTKASADALVAQAEALAPVILRPSSVFGPGMPNRSLFALIGALDRGWFFFVGRGAIANYVYVEDVADALLSCGTAPAARGVYNLSDDRPMEQFVGAIAGALGRPAPRLRVPEPVARAMAALLGAVPGFPLTASRVEALSRRVRYPPARIQRELGYSFGVSVEQGLQRLVADWRACR